MQFELSFLTYKAHMGYEKCMVKKVGRELKSLKTAALYYMI